MLWSGRCWIAIVALIKVCIVRSAYLIRITLITRGLIILLPRIVLLLNCLWIIGWLTTLRRWILVSITLNWLCHAFNEMLK